MDAPAAFAALFVAVVGVGVTLMVLRREHEPIKSREWKASVASALAAAVFYVSFSIQDEFIFYDYAYPCNFNLWTGVLFLPMWLGPYFVRAFVLYYKFRLQELRLKGITEHDERVSWLLRYRWILNRPLWLIVMTTVNVAVVVATLLARYLTPGQPPDSEFIASDCNANAVATVIDLVLAALSLLSLAIAVGVLFRVRDGFYFKTELAALFFAGLPVAILWGVGTVNQVYPPALPPSAFVYILLYISVGVTVVFPVYLTYARFYQLRHEASEHVNSGASSEITIGSAEPVPIGALGAHQLLEYVLADEVLATEFKKFAAQSWCVENVFFALDARKYRQLQDQVKRDAEARRMLYQYFFSTSTMELNLDEEEKAEVRQRVKRDEITPSLFDKPEQLVLQVLQNDTLHKWRQTPLFQAAVAASSLAPLVVLDPMDARATLAIPRKKSRSSSIALAVGSRGKRRGAEGGSGDDAAGSRPSADGPAP